MSSLAVFSPAKINLFLAITERRPDGFHNLVSVVAPLTFGDQLLFEPGDAGGEFTLSCDDPAVPCDGSNLVLKAAQEFASACSWTRGGHFHLTKRIPMGAGLGGGSSNASAALRVLNQTAGHPLSDAELGTLSARIGSDCPLFFAKGPVVMRGRGETLTPLPESAAARLSGRRVLLFKPSFGISTPWAYQQLASCAPAGYLAPTLAEARLETWINDPSAPAESLLYNNMEAPAFRKYVAMPVLLNKLTEDYGVQPRMSGSGSACFCFLPEGGQVEALRATIQACWGAGALVQEASVLHPGANGY